MGPAGPFLYIFYDMYKEKACNLDLSAWSRY